MTTVRNLRTPYLLAIPFFLLVFFSSCVSVQEYEKIYLNEEEMALEAGTLESYELSFQSYREGASGANGAAVGGGCGCR